MKIYIAKNWNKIEFKAALNAFTKHKTQNTKLLTSFFYIEGTRILLENIKYENKQKRIT